MTGAFLEALDGVIARYRLLEHPFYRAWSAGVLGRDILAAYARQYYAHVERFPRYLSGVHSRTEDPEVRRELLANLVDEEGGEETHPALWRRFAAALGVGEEELAAAELLPETRASVDTFLRLTQGEDPIPGLAALYAYESQVPEIARSKREGLARFYGLTDPAATAYFAVHEEADLRHREGERRALVRLCRTEAGREAALGGAAAGARAMWRFLDGMERVRTGA